MKKTQLALVIASLLVASAAQAAVKTYQVTGPVLEVTETTLVVQKGTEKWEIARDATTQVKGELVKGAKVTVQYRMTAAEVEVKADKKAEKKADKKAK